MLGEIHPSCLKTGGEEEEEKKTKKNEKQDEKEEQDENEKKSVRCEQGRINHPGVGGASQRKARALFSYM